MNCEIAIITTMYLRRSGMRSLIEQLHTTGRGRWRRENCRDFPALNYPFSLRIYSSATVADRKER